MTGIILWFGQIPAAGRNDNRHNDDGCMTHIFVEIWSERLTWRAIDADARAIILERVAAAVEPILRQDIVCLVAGNVEGGDWQHVAVWRATDAAVVGKLRAALRDAGWYDWFDQLDLSGPETALGDILSRHAQGNTEAPMVRFWDCSSV